MLVRLGIGVHADDAGGGPREHLGAISLAAGHVEHVQAGDLPRDPLVDDEMPAEPVVLLGHVRERALPREGERRDALGLITLQVEG